MDERFLQQGVDKTLAHVVEECGEVLAAAGKCQRWGMDSVNPLLPPEQQETNRKWLLRELTDLKDAIKRLEGEIGNELAERHCKRREDELKGENRG